MTYAKYSRRVREYQPKHLTNLRDFCQAHGFVYYVVTETPTHFELDPNLQHVYENYPGRSVSIPLSPQQVKNRPVEVLEFLSYVARKYDARETIARWHRSLPRTL